MKCNGSKKRYTDPETEKTRMKYNDPMKQKMHDWFFEHCIPVPEAENYAPDNENGGYIRIDGPQAESIEGVLNGNFLDKYPEEIIKEVVEDIIGLVEDDECVIKQRSKALKSKKKK